MNKPSKKSASKKTTKSASSAAQTTDKNTKQNPDNGEAASESATLKSKSEKGKGGLKSADPSSSPQTSEAKKEQMNSNSQTTDAQTADSSPDSQTADQDEPKLAGHDPETLRDMYVRALAEQENIMKRAAADVRKARDFALQSFAPGICEVLDCLQAAAADAAKANSELPAGVSLTMRKLSSVMEANGILPVNPDLGATFDPSLHQAIGVDSQSKHPVNTVAAVIQCGYTLNGRMVRPANIIVSKPETASDQSETNKSDSDK